jgi:hypothetical protein
MLIKNYQTGQSSHCDLFGHFATLEIFCKFLSSRFFFSVNYELNLASLAFALCITRIRARANTNNIFNTQYRVSIDAGLKSVKADRVLYLNSRRDKKIINIWKMLRFTFQTSINLFESEQGLGTKVSEWVSDSRINKNTRLFIGSFPLHLIMCTWKQAKLNSQLN